MTDCFYRMGLRGWILIFAVTLVAGLLGFSKQGLAAGGGDYTATPTTPPAIAKAQKAINKNDFAAAYAILSQNENQYKNNADLYNLMGFSARKLGRYDDSMAYYTKALDINPKHKGALEYMGELYLTLEQPEKAKALLARLEQICTFGCEEKRELQEAIAKWEAEN
ncbi:MAG: tetratricopeptide repeat protein [Candidatus Puniceispirillales bacterium]|nr:tetratricopeptide repeat protein [Pseudomonadota bacterium]